MSVFQPKRLTCPHCQMEEQRTVVASLNVGRHPERRDEILAETFQRFTCGRCAREFVYEGPFSYLSFPDREFILVYPRAAERSWRTLEQETAASFTRNLIELAPPFLGIHRAAYFVRTVFGLAGLREKILCRREGIDDAELEALKLALLRRQPDLSLAAENRPRLRAVEEDTLELLFVPEGRLLRVPRAEILRMREPAWTQVVKELHGPAYVDLGRLLLRGESSLDATAPGAT